MRTSLLLSLGVAMNFVVLAVRDGGAAAEEDRAARDSIVVKGTVTGITADKKGDKILGEILVEVDSKGDRIFLVSKNTQISLADKTSGKWSDLRVKQRVRITYNGIVAPSNPPQAGADAIMIEADPKSKKQE
jgi:hypothetical protein